MSRETRTAGFNTRARQSRRIGWVLMVVLACSALTGCGYTVGGSPASSEAAPLPSSEFSMLNEAGLAQIQESMSVRLDFRTGSIAKSDVGLPDSAYGPEVVAPEGEKFQLSIVGTQGTVRAETDHVRFTTTDTMPTMDVIYYFLTADSDEDYFALIRDGVEKYGIYAETAERWIEGAKARPDVKSNFALPEGFTPGFGVSYDLRYDRNKQTQVIIVSVTAI